MASSKREERGEVAPEGITHARIPLASIQRHPRNYKQHPPEQLVKIKASLLRFGQVRSIVVQAGAPGHFLLVAGEGLYTSASELVAEGQRPELASLNADIIPASWSAQQVEGYLVADNETGRDAVDDLQVLAEILQEQANAGLPLESLGHDAASLASLLEELTQAQLEGDATDDGAEESGDTPEDFPAYDADTLETDYCCPKCGYKWSGKPN